MVLFMQNIPFIKMNGAGNDFAFFDARFTPLPPLNWKKIADRHFGIGCDQIIVMEKAPDADVMMRIYNADGSESGACGNASRCLGWLMNVEQKKNDITIKTIRHTITAHVKNNVVTLDMGEAALDWKDIPLAKEIDTLHLPIKSGMLSDPVGVGMGNPHMVFFVDDVNAIPLAQRGPELEQHPLYPKKTNVEAAQIASKNEINLRVWERGTGLTLACGTGACATLVAAVRRGLTERKAKINLPGGALDIEWRESDNHVLMTGPVAVNFQGTIKAEDYSL